MFDEMDRKKKSVFELEERNNDNNYVYSLKLNIY